MKRTLIWVGDAGNPALGSGTLQSVVVTHRLDEHTAPESGRVLPPARPRIEPLKCADVVFMAVLWGGGAARRRREDGHHAHHPAAAIGTARQFDPGHAAQEIGDRFDGG